MASTAAPRRRRAVVLVAAVGALLLAGLTWWVFGGDTPTEVAIDDAVAGLDDDPADDDPEGEAGDEEPEVADTGGTAGGGSAPDEAVDGGDTDGTWTVDTEVEPFDLAASTGSFLGYRIDEELANVGATQAVGRTPAVAGTLTVDGTSVTDAVVEGELDELRSDRPQRDGRVAGALEADEHPVVRFAAEPFELPEPLDDGDRLEVDVPGTVEAAGGSTEVVARTTAQRVGDVVVATGYVDVALEELGITAPSAAIVLGVADTATIEWQLYLTRD